MTTPRLTDSELAKIRELYQRLIKATTERTITWKRRVGAASFHFEAKSGALVRSDQNEIAVYDTDGNRVATYGDHDQALYSLVCKAWDEEVGFIVAGILDDIEGRG